jgi:hypothetical protein
LPQKLNPEGICRGYLHKGMLSEKIKENPFLSN